MLGCGIIQKFLAIITYATFFYSGKISKLWKKLNDAMTAIESTENTVFQIKGAGFKF